MKNFPTKIKSWFDLLIQLLLLFFLSFIKLSKPSQSLTMEDVDSMIPGKKSSLDQQRNNLNRDSFGRGGVMRGGG